MKLKEVVESIDVEKIAIEAAISNLPDTKSKKPDHNEDHIIQSLTNALYEEIEIINNKINVFRNLISRKIEESKNSIEVAIKAPKNFSHAVSALKIKQLKMIERLKIELKVKKNDLVMFKNKHQLERSANYPTSSNMVYAV